MRPLHSIAKAEASTYIILWIMSLVATLVAVGWYVENVRPYNVEARAIQDDLVRIENTINTACLENRLFLNATLYFSLQQGELRIQNTGACIEHQFELCTRFICATGVEKNISLERLEPISVIKENGAISIS
ncbi:MAG: hypothetical protein ACMXYF_04070 [Candidatus Woesearchaeota archaeon]